MPRVSCRCGEKLKVQPDGPDRIDCPKCGAKIRLRRAVRPPVLEGTGDGFMRFRCPCGRRLKVSRAESPVVGKCPDCGRVVPVPTAVRAPASAIPPRPGSQNDPNARTEELDGEDVAQLQAWSARCALKPGHPHHQSPSTTHLNAVAVNAEPDTNLGFLTVRPSSGSAVKFEAGLRVCPRCKKPVHLGAAICRECGTPVPRQ